MCLFFLASVNLEQFPHCLSFKILTFFIGTGQLFCIPFLNLSSSDVLGQRHTGHDFWQEYYQSDVSFPVHGTRKCMMLIYLFTGGINFDLLAKGNVCRVFQTLHHYHLGWIIVESWRVECCPGPCRCLVFSLASTRQMPQHPKCDKLKCPQASPNVFQGGKNPFPLS